jgi:5'-3' exonuclease
VGDKSDNIPGIYGVGEVAANLLINQFDRIENIYAALKLTEPGTATAKPKRKPKRRKKGEGDSGS